MKVSDKYTLNQTVCFSETVLAVVIHTLLTQIMTNTFKETRLFIIKPKNEQIQVIVNNILFFAHLMDVNSFKQWGINPSAAYSLYLINKRNKVKNNIILIIP